MTFDAPDVSADVAELQARLYRNMSPDRKLRIADDLWALTLSGVMAGIRLREPDLDETVVERKARQLLNATK